MKRVIITVPRSNEGWRLSGLGTRYRRYHSASTTLRSIEKRLSVSKLRKKMSIKVKYRDGKSNESVASDDPRYLVFVTAAFLEDFLNKQTMNSMEKKYL